MTTRWIEANGIQLRYELKQGPDAPLVLIHEMGGMLESWDDVAPILSKSGAILRYDLRGVGLSETVPGPVTVEGLADDLAGLLDGLSIGRPVAVAGTAVGAAVAAVFAARHPERAGALIMLAPALDLKGARREAALRRIEAIEKTGVRQAFAVDGFTVPPRFAALRLASDPIGLGALWRMLADLEIGAMLPAIACPTLVATAARDTARPPQEIARIAAAIPGARMIALDASHFMAMENPELVSATIHGFLTACGFWPEGG
ncbi:alpha/beta fold hydrolase [Labrys neptuniae]